MKWIVTLASLCLLHEAIAQKQASNWYFGDHAGLNFSVSCQPTQINASGMGTQEGSATISDPETGELLFYSDAVKVWNRENKPMPNSGDDDPTEGVNRRYSALSQGALIVPAPGDPSIYYLFSLIAADPQKTGGKYPGALAYSRIDMGLDGGKGDVVTDDENTFLSDGLAGRLTAVPHTNGRDYWLITHQWNTNAFLVYPITTKGIGQADTVRIGSVQQGVYGILKASPDGRKLACSSRGATARPFDLFDFNASTGQITNYINLGAIRVGYGVSFSPDNTKLYVTTMKTAGSDGNTHYPELIRQYNLQAGGSEAVAASGKSIIYQNPLTNINQQQDRFSDFYAPSLQIGSDGRIYCASNGNSSLCKNCGFRFFIINKPNESGFACQVKVQVTELATGMVGNASDLPNFMQHYFDGIQPQICAFDENETCGEGNVQLSPNPANDYVELLITDLCFTKYDLRIIDVSGRVLASYAITEPSSQRIDISCLSAGIYFAEMRFKNRTTVKRFLKY